MVLLNIVQSHHLVSRLDNSSSWHPFILGLVLLSVLGFFFFGLFPLVLIIIIILIFVTALIITVIGPVLNLNRLVYLRWLWLILWLPIGIPLILLIKPARAPGITVILIIIFTGFYTRYS